MKKLERKRCKFCDGTGKRAYWSKEKGELVYGCVHCKGKGYEK